MDTYIHQGDHATSPNGSPVKIVGNAVTLQQAFFRLTVPLGAFPYDRKLGSTLHLLSPTHPHVQRAARSAVETALKPLPQIVVKEVHCRFPTPDSVFVDMELSIKSHTMEDHTIRDLALKDTDYTVILEVT